MTREEAIEIIRDTPIDLRSTREDDIHTLYATAQMIAIDALLQVEELEAEIDVLNWTIEKLSKERPKGRWISNGIPESILRGCSACGYTCGAYTFNYCPNCGADMRGEEE